MPMAAAALPAIVQAAMLASAAELGDRTFCVAMLLSAWAAQCTKARVLVFFGCMSALCFHASCTAFAHKVDVIVTHHSSMHFFAAALFLGLGMKALLDLGRADGEVLRMRQKKLEAYLLEQGKLGSPTLANTDDSNPFSPINGENSEETRLVGEEEDGDRDGYGSALQESHMYVPVASPKGAPEDPQENNYVALIGVFLSAFLIDCIAELGDKSAITLNQSTLRGRALFVGAVIGYAASTSLSVAIGMMMRWHLTERRLLFGVVLMSFALSMACLSEGLTCFGQTHKWTALLPIHSTVTKTSGAEGIESLLQVES